LRTEGLIPQLQHKARFRIEPGKGPLILIRALTSFLIKLRICSSVLIWPSWTIAFLCNQRWYTAAHHDNLQMVDLSPTLKIFLIPHSTISFLITSIIYLFFVFFVFLYLFSFPQLESTFSHCCIKCSHPNVTKPSQATKTEDQISVAKEQWSSKQSIDSPSSFTYITPINYQQVTLMEIINYQNFP
jgi:hypothetical protein